MLNRLFITGTNTRVGKTVVARALLQALVCSGKSAVGYKPVVRKGPGKQPANQSKEIAILQSASSHILPAEAISPLVLNEGGTPGTPAQMDYSLMSNGLADLSHQYDSVMIEGCSGWRSLMDDLHPLSEWVVQEQLPVLMVVGIQDGCMNHAQLTAQAILHDGLPLIGWVANRINPCMANYASIIEALSKVLPCPLLGEIPYLSRPEEKELGHFIDLSVLSDSPIYA
ncbi:dethiobiotin synthase [Klebsiella sp. BIGb0407]|uniref:dethiobiotin synthase n=1 Tax=Klebsiella sp. BIGb0407 TaxID=2940603 RepID=UPI002168E216|nr:dethiobiotin synthase [Klebsiella sp. BIGb0407]MCS3429998.1 dethiobiotin synthetase [Klebsiella sp. BIGb0407]